MKKWGLLHDTALLRSVKDRTRSAYIRHILRLEVMGLIYSDPYRLHVYRINNSLILSIYERLFI